MLNGRDITIRASLLTGFRELIEARGVEMDDLLTDAGLAPEELDDPEATLPLSAVARLMETAAARAKDPCLGLAFAEAYPPGASGPLGYLVLNATTIKESLNALARYVGLVLNPITAELREDGGVATLSWRFPASLGGAYDQFASFALGVVVIRLRQIAGRDWHPLMVKAEHREPPCTSLVHRVLGPRVAFNARTNLIAVDGRSLLRRSDRADPRLYAILKETCEARLRELSARPDLIARTSRAIVETLNSAPPLLENVAKSMRITPRALQHRLAQQGTTFERVLVETRRVMAERYLRDTDLSLTEIAFLLGFSEHSAFTRAARGWFGCPPRYMRQQTRRARPRAGVSPKPPRGLRR